MRMLSHIASNMLGSVGGITYLNNPFHQIVGRQRTVPVQPNTNSQVFAKTAFSDAVQAWENTSISFREGWEAYAQTVTYQGPLGPYQPSGRMLAIAQYQIVGYLINAGHAIFADGLSMEPPVLPGLLVIQNPNRLNPPGGTTGFTIETTNNNGEGVFNYMVRSFLQSAARNFYKGPFLTSTLDTVGFATGASGEIDFTGLIDLGVYFARGRFISSLKPYRFSQQFILRAIASTSI